MCWLVVIARFEKVQNNSKPILPEKHTWAQILFIQTVYLQVRINRGWFGEDQAQALCLPTVSLQVHIQSG